MIRFPIRQDSDSLWAMPQAARALMLRTQSLRLFAVPVSIAIALSGCRFDSPKQAAQEPEPVKEASLSCYWFVQDYASLPSVQAAMADGVLTDRECSDVIMPLVESANADAVVRRRAEAVKAVRAASGRTGA